MIQVKDIDLRGLQFMLNGLRHALIASGKDGDAAKVVADEARLLSVEIARQLSPKTQAAGVNKVERDVRRLLVAMPESNIQGDKESEGVVWLRAGPTFLHGVSRDNFWPNADNATALTLMQMQRNNRVGPRFLEGAKRGNQSVKLYNRPVVPELQRYNVTRILSDRIGRLKASVLESAEKLGQKGIPSWIRKHFPSPKGTFIDGLSAVASPSVTFGSHAVGIEKFQPAFKKAVKNRQFKLRERIKQLLTGYAHDAHEHRPIRHHAKQSNQEAVE